MNESTIDQVALAWLDGLTELNRSLRVSGLDDGCRKLTRPDGSTLDARNCASRAEHLVAYGLQ